MKRIAWVALWGLLGLFALTTALGPVFTRAGGAVPADDWTTVVLVRHAEKQSEAEDPALSGRGRERAAALARVLADAGVTALVASQYRRTHETLEPLARRTGLEVRTVAAAAELSGHVAETVSLVDGQRGGVVVIAGHSNTLPALIAGLGVEQPPVLDHDDYDDLFLVMRGPGRRARLTHLHYGAPSP